MDYFPQVGSLVSAWLDSQLTVVLTHSDHMRSLCSYRICRAELPENSRDFLPSHLYRWTPGACRGGVCASSLEVAAVHRYSAQLLLLALLLVSLFGTKKEIN